MVTLAEQGLEVLHARTWSIRIAHDTEEELKDRPDVGEGRHEIFLHQSIAVEEKQSCGSPHGALLHYRQSVELVYETLSRFFSRRYYSRGGEERTGKGDCK